MKFPTKAKLVVKEIVPPFLWKAFKKLHQSEEYGFFGDYSSWEEARKDSLGYNSDVILNKVKNALLQVKEGKAVYERDSVLFDKIEYPFPVLSALLRIALEMEGKLSVLDFGGSLGSSYFQCNGFLSRVTELRWSIVEQPKFFVCGKQYFEDEQLKFYESIEICLENEKPNVILLSSVIQYLEKPCEFIETLVKLNFLYIVVDRTFFSDNNRIFLTVHKVDPKIYEATIPTWLLNLEAIYEMMLPHYELIFEFNSLLKINSCPRIIIHDRGFLLKLQTQ